MSVLQLTIKELEDIVGQSRRDTSGRFVVLHNKIPYDSNDPDDDPSNYIEDDGRQLRYFEFEDTITKTVYGFTYVWHAEHGYDLKYGMLDAPKNLDFVDVSVINPPQPPAPEPLPVLSAEQIADKKLWADYEAAYKTPFDPKKKQVPQAIINTIVAFVKTTKWSMIDLRAKLIPVCIHYGVEQQTFWRHIQSKASKKSKK